MTRQRDIRIDRITVRVPSGMTERSADEAARSVARALQRELGPVSARDTRGRRAHGQIPSEIAADVSAAIRRRSAR